VLYSHLSFHQEELNSEEAREIGGPLKRKWDVKEHTRFLVAFKLFQKLPIPEKFEKMAKYIKTRSPTEVQLRCNIYEFHIVIPREKQARIDWHEFTTPIWTKEEQLLLEREYMALENSGKK
jgi:hypothetical protein